MSGWPDTRETVPSADTPKGPHLHPALALPQRPPASLCSGFAGVCGRDAEDARGSQSPSTGNKGSTRRGLQTKGGSKRGWRSLTSGVKVNPAWECGSSQMNFSPSSTKLVEHRFGSVLQTRGGK